MLARRKFLVGTAAALALPSSGAFAQNYPNHTIKIIVPTPAGGPVDTMARILANALPAILGQPVVVENRAGAGNTLGSKAAAVADPDGYTLSYTAASGLIMSPMLYKSAGYTAADFAPIAIISETPQVFVAHPGAPFKSVPELVAYARANPVSSTIRPAARARCRISRPNCSRSSAAHRSRMCPTRAADRRWPTSSRDRCI